MKLIDKDALVAEVQRLQDLTMDENKNFYSEAAEGEYNALCNIEHFIDSLQEEPKPQFKVGDTIRSKVWERAVHKIVSMDDGAYFFENGGMVKFADQEQWELAEEPISEEVNKEAAEALFDIASLLPTSEGREKDVVEKIRLICQDYGFKGIGCPIEEFVSEDLEKAAGKASAEAFFVSPQWTSVGKELLKAGALWQKQQDSKLPKVWDRETLDGYAYQVAYDLSNDWMKETPTWDNVETAVKLGAKWQKAHNWKPADGDDLPEIDKEVIVLTQKYPLKGSEYAVSFAHRPYKGKYIGKNLTTGNIETFENKTYDKGGWSIPDVKWWLDCGWPNEEE